MATLTEEVRRRDIDVMEEVFVTNLLMSSGRVSGSGLFLERRELVGLVLGHVLERLAQLRGGRGAYREDGGQRGDGHRLDRRVVDRQCEAEVAARLTRAGQSPKVLSASAVVGREKATAAARAARPSRARAV